METGIIFIISCLLALLFDMALQNQIQLIYGATTTGKRPLKYSANATKMVLLGIWIILINVVIYQRNSASTLLLFSAFFAAIIYVVYASIYAIRLMSIDP